MVESILVEISIIIGLAALITIIARAIKQPPIIAYLISGILVGPLVFGLIESNELIQTFAHLGVALLLFIAGLSLDFRVLRDIGGVASLAGLGEIIVTGTIGFLIAIGLGFGYTPALYLGAALSFSSTVVVVKILSDKKEIDTLHGRIALGILIVEDFVAALVLMIIPVLQTGGLNEVVLEVGKALGLILVLFVFSGIVLKRFMHYLARNQEVLFLFGIAWALIIASLFDYLGFSLEIGALIAGMSLASTKYTLELGGKIKPLRDFFVVLFFVFFGSQLVGEISLGLFKQALLFSLFVLIGKPIIVMTFMRLFGYKKRTNFLAGSSLAQISEFSLILILLGFTLGYLTQEIMSLAILIALITIGLSSYSIYYSHHIFNKISRILGIFDGHKFHKELKIVSGYDIVLFGYHRIGYKLLETLQKMKVDFIVIDYNPKVIFELSRKRINCVYGDASDREFIEDLRLDQSKLVISTIPDLESNLVIIKRLDEAGSNATFIATAEHIADAIELYKLGADYVIVPHLLGGERASSLIKDKNMSKEKYKEEGKKNLKELKEMNKS